MIPPAIVLPLSSVIKEPMKMSHRPLLMTCALALAAITPSPIYAADVGPRVKLHDGQTLMGRFTHEHPVKGYDKPIKTEGNFTIAPGDMITWQIEKPMMTNTIINAKGLTQTIGDFPLLQVKPQQVPYLRNLETDLLWALSGNWDKLRGNFQISTKGSDQAWVVTIQPLEKQGTAKPFQKIVARGGQYVESADVMLRGGAVDHLTFSEQFVTPR